MYTFISQKIDLIKNEFRRSANTASRIGNVLKDVLSFANSEPSMTTSDLAAFDLNYESTSVIVLNRDKVPNVTIKSLSNARGHATLIVKNGYVEKWDFAVVKPLNIYDEYRDGKATNIYTVFHDGGIFYVQCAYYF
jgi:hypothetical protein